MSHLRSTAKTVGNVIGNHMLDTATTIVDAIRVPKRMRDDAIMVAVLAHLDGRDVVRAVRRFVSAERRPACVPLESAHGDSPEDELLRRETRLSQAERAERGLERLTSREQEIARLHAGGWTQAEVGQKFGLSRQRVAAILTKIQSKSNG